MNQILRPDPYDPFSNPTQHRTYASHYRSILPQIELPGYQIPLSPTKQERKRIRHYFNAVGFGFFAHFFFVQIAAILLMLLFDFILGLSGNPMDPDTYIEQSSMLIALNGLIFLTANTGVASIGCRATNIPIRSFFRTNQFRFSDVVPYLFIGIFIQCITGYAASWITMLLDQGGITAYEPNIDYYGTGTAIAAEILYSCLIAPHYRRAALPWLCTEKSLPCQPAHRHSFDCISLRFGASKYCTVCPRLSAWYFPRCHYGTA